MSDTTTGLTATYGHGSITLTLYQGSGRVGVVQRGENAVMDVVDLLDFATDVAAVYGQDDSITELERKYAAALENEAFAAGIIELLRGMVDGEAFDVCEEFTEQRHSPVSPITTVRRERDEARGHIRAMAKWVGVPEDTPLLDIAVEVSASLEMHLDVLRERDEARAEMERLKEATAIVRESERVSRQVGSSVEQVAELLVRMGAGEAHRRVAELEAALQRERDEARAEMERLTTIVGRQERYIEGLENVDAAGLKARAEKAETEVKRWEDKYPCDGGCSYGDGPQEECTRHGRDQQDLWRIIGENVEGRLKAQAALERVREARSNHPECDRHDESDPVTCGWKRTVQDIDLALIRNETDTKETP